MKNFFIDSFSFVIAFVIAFALTWLWFPIYNWINPQEGGVQALLQFTFAIISLLVFVFTAMFLPGLMKILLNKEDRLWKKIKKSFPHWAEASIESGSLTVHWFEGYRDSPELVHNYKFDLKNNRAKFYDSSDNDHVLFEGTIKEAIVQLG